MENIKDISAISAAFCISAWKASLTFIIIITIIIIIIIIVVTTIITTIIIGVEVLTFKSDPASVVFIYLFNDHVKFNTWHIRLNLRDDLLVNKMMMMVMMVMMMMTMMMMMLKMEVLVMW